MSDPYTSLLDAVIAHLAELKADGGKFVSVSPDVLAALATPMPKTLAASVPVPARIAPAPAPKAPTPALPPAPAPVARVPLPSRGESFTAPVLQLEEKVRALDGLRSRVLGCELCPHLVASRRNVVFGVGNPEAALMFVGEAPGVDEDRLGEPFVGAAGELLTKIIKAMGFTRDTVYIGNILKCRPDTPGQATGNRKPTPEEMATCLPYLLTQIELIRPRVLVSLGATGTTGLLGLTDGITRLRGRWQTFRGIPVMPPYHPSYLLHKPDLSEKRKVWEDMLQVMEKLAAPISDKQRGFFLNP